MKQKLGRFAIHHTRMHTHTHARTHTDTHILTKMCQWVQRNTVAFVRHSLLLSSTSSFLVSSSIFSFLFSFSFYFVFFFIFYFCFSFLSFFIAVFYTFISNTHTLIQFSSNQTVCLLRAKERQNAFFLQTHTCAHIL